MKNFLIIMASLAICGACRSIDDPVNNSDNPGGSENSEVPGVVKPVSKVSLTEEQKGYVNAGKSLAFEVLAKCAGEESCVFSPLSIENMLGMVVNVVPEDERSMVCDVLGYGQGNPAVVNEHLQNLCGQIYNLSDDVQLSNANLFLSKEENDALEAVLANYYSAVCGRISDSEEEDLAFLNKWISEATGGLIKEIGLYHDKASWLAYNAIYFKGGWLMPFDPEKTQAMQFRKNNGGQCSVDMMQRSGQSVYFEGESCKAVRLFYGLGEFAMTVILPDSEEDFAEFAGSVDKVLWDEIQAAMTVCAVDLKLPKFSVKTSGTNEELLLECFTETQMNGAWFETALSISEEGAEAASTSQGGNLSIDSPDDPEAREFTADHPFIFVISENSSGAILFIGQFCGN